MSGAFKHNAKKKKDKLKSKIDMKNICLKYKLLNITVLNLDLSPFVITVLISQVLNYYKICNRNMKSTNKLILHVFSHSFCSFFPLPSVTTISLQSLLACARLKSLRTKKYYLCTAIIHHTGSIISSLP